MLVIHTPASFIWMRITSMGVQCGFRFLQPDEIEALTPVGELSDGDEDGYIYEVDLHYPQHLHDAHNDYPVAPESLEIGSDMYSPA